jgi:hypothetical protein
MANVILIVPLLPLQGDNLLNCHWPPQKDAYSPRHRRWRRLWFKMSVNKQRCVPTSMLSMITADVAVSWWVLPFHRRHFTTPQPHYLCSEGRGKNRMAIEKIRVGVKIWNGFGSLSLSLCLLSHRFTLTHTHLSLPHLKKKNTLNTFKCTHMFIILLSLYLLKKIRIAPTPQIYKYESIARYQCSAIYHVLNEQKRERKSCRVHS